MVRDENITDPKAPEIVLLGLILVNFGPPSNLPKTNPPISDAIQLNKKINRIIFRLKKYDRYMKKKLNKKTYEINKIFVE